MAASMKLNQLNSLKSIHRKLGAVRFAARVWAFPEHKLVYISNPKAACSTIKEHMRRLTEMPNITPRDRHRLSTVRVGAILRKAESKGADLKDCFVFSSVRDPIRRVISGFNDKFARRNRVEKAFRRKNGIAKDVVIDWPLFIEHLRSTPLRDLDAHWRPQHLNLLHGQIHIDRLVRVESLQTDLADVVQGHFPGKTLDEIHQNASGKKILSAKDIALREKLTLLRLYAVDYHVYGYGNRWERLFTLPDYWSYKRNPARYNARSLKKRALL